MVRIPGKWAYDLEARLRQSRLQPATPTNYAWRRSLGFERHHLQVRAVVRLHSRDPPRGQVVVISAKGLRDADWMGSSDPYCVSRRGARRR